MRLWTSEAGDDETAGRSNRSMNGDLQSCFK